MRLIELYLREAKCPKCGEDGAYIGLNDVECPNPKCQMYKKGVDPVFSPLPPGPKIHGINFDEIPEE